MVVLVGGDGAPLAPPLCPTPVRSAELHALREECKRGGDEHSVADIDGTYYRLERSDYSIVPPNASPVLAARASAALCASALRLRKSMKDRQSGLKPGDMNYKRWVLGPGEMGLLSYRQFLEARFGVCMGGRGPNWLTRTICRMQPKLRSLKAR